jgi:hypothetical protein
MLIHREPRVVVLRKHKTYFLAKNTLASMCWVVERVTGSDFLFGPISESQVVEIRKLAARNGIEVKLVEGQPEIDSLAMRGECELTPHEWRVLNDRALAGRN